MTKIISVKNIEIGKGKPKICVPIVGSSLEDILFCINDINSSGVDLVEWRADYYSDGNIDSILKALDDISNALDYKIGLIFTFRRSIEGGKGILGEAKYAELCKKIIDKRLVDIIDVEVSISEDIFRDIVSYSNSKGVYVIGSSHNFEFTPENEVLTDIFEKMSNLGADILKLAVMPNKKEDVGRILDFSAISSERFDSPLIVISMGEMGRISRITGEIYGSSITFASIGESSAPGQIEVDEMKKLLEDIHIRGGFNV